MATALPIFLNLAGLRVLVVGGGPVGRRKAVAAVGAGAAARLVCPAPRPADFDSPGVEWLQAPYDETHLAGVALAFAAATPEVNAAVVADALRLGVFVNDAARPGRGNFTLPAVGRAGGVTLAVGTGGAAPGIAAHLRDRLLEAIDPAVPAWLELVEELRPAILEAVADPARRRELFAALADPAWAGRLRVEGREAVRAAMAGLIPRRR